MAAKKTTKKKVAKKKATGRPKGKIVISKTVRLMSETELDEWATKQIAEKGKTDGRDKKTLLADVAAAKEKHGAKDGEATPSTTLGKELTATEKAARLLANEKNRKAVLLLLSDDVLTALETAAKDAKAEKKRQKKAAAEAEAKAALQKAADLGIDLSTLTASVSKID